MMTKRQVMQSLVDSLKPIQREMLRRFVSAKQLTTVLHCSRRLGKTHFLCVVAILFALKKPQAQIRYATVSQKAARKMAHPIFKQLFLQMPARFRGQWNGLEGAYIFANGSQIHLSGANAQRADDLRGTSADLALVDEAAFVDELSYLVDSVLMPQLLTVPDSRLIMASSSPLSPEHEFCDYIAKARMEGAYHSYTIHEAAYSAALVDEFCREAGGPLATTWRREYLNEIVLEDDAAIIPEAQGFQPGVVVTPERRHYENLVAMDIGVRDLTVVLFGHYDFKRAKLCIERELVMSGPRMITPDLAAGVNQIEAELFPKGQPVRRIADNNNLLLLQDLGHLHGCHFIPTGKDSLEAMVNEMRLWFKNSRVEIAPECPVLLQSLSTGFWNSTRSEFGRSAALGHFDALAALMYMIRNVDQITNPLPVVVGFDEFYLPENDERFDDLKSLVTL